MEIKDENMATSRKNNILFWSGVGLLLVAITAVWYFGFYRPGHPAISKAPASKSTNSPATHRNLDQAPAVSFIGTEDLVKEVLEMRDLLKSGTVSVSNNLANISADLATFRGAISSNQTAVFEKLEKMSAEMASNNVALRAEMRSVADEKVTRALEPVVKKLNDLQAQVNTPPPGPFPISLIQSNNAAILADVTKMVDEKLAKAIEPLKRLLPQTNSAPTQAPVEPAKLAPAVTINNGNSVPTGTVARAESPSVVINNQNWLGGPLPLNTTNNPSLPPVAWTWLLGSPSSN